MPDATKPDAGGGTTAATPPAGPNTALASQTPTDPVNPAASLEPTAADVLVLVGALCGQEAAAAVTQAVAEAAEMGVPCAAYATLAAKFGAAQAAQKSSTVEQPKPLQLLTAALARPSAPGTPAPARTASFADYVKAHFPGKEAN